MRFEIVATSGGARAGVLETPHGAIETPVFMPVGTRGTVRTQPRSQLERLGPPIVLANTYHLMLRPGPELFERFGGLHRWMGWDRAILTDSGGYQVFSLPHERELSDDGATFRTADGARVVLTPERSIAMQRAIGSDIMMVLDHCIAATRPHAEAEAAMARTHRWAARSLAARAAAPPAYGHPQALFAIVQGACFEDLRRRSAAALTELGGFDGYAIGGLAVGETRAQREDLTELTASLLPTDRPRYLMGVGTPLDLVEAVHRGVDMFDCVLPTSWAQQGIAFTSRGKVDLRRGVYKLADQPLDAACGCEACAAHSRSYLHHLVRSKEPLGWQLLAFHNLRFYLGLAAAMRAHVRAGTFAAFHAAERERLGQVDLDNPPGPRPAARAGRPRTRGAFGVHASPRGFSSIRHLPSGEVMHASNDPDVEAERVYVAQSALIARALEPAAAARPLIVWDVGLGAAHNAMALVRRLDAAGPGGHAPVELISFERDLDALRLALAHTGAFPHLRHAAPHRLAHAGAFRRAGLTWTLCEGDFHARAAALAPPDVIFFDPFSPKVDAAMWSLAAFRALFARLAGPAELFTYSRSTAVRSAMLAAGFHVARGVASGMKPETTVALVPGPGAALARHALLDHAWLARRARSTAPIGADVAPVERDAVERAIAAHAQFAASE